MGIKTKKFGMCMTLGDLISALKIPDIKELKAPSWAEFDLPVVFDTSTRTNLHLLSVYYDKEDKVIRVDIGD